MAILKGDKILSRGGVDWSSAVRITATPFTCPNHGYVCINMNGQTHSTNEVYINGIKIGCAYAINNYQESCLQVQVPVSKGDVVTYVGTLLLGLFFSLKG